jgi:hypothetical protein
MNRHVGIQLLLRGQQVVARNFNLRQVIQHRLPERVLQLGYRPAAVQEAAHGLPQAVPAGHASEILLGPRFRVPNQPASFFLEIAADLQFEEQRDDLCHV